MNTASQSAAQPAATTAGKTIRKRVAILFAAVFVVYHAAFFALFFYTLGNGFDAMRTGTPDDTVLLAFCNQLLYVLLWPAQQLHQALAWLPADLWLQWLLFFAVNCVYCLLITGCLLLIGRKQRRGRYNS